MNAKTIIYSWTLWGNVFVVAAAWLLNHQGLLPALGLDADQVGAIIAVANVINRFARLMDAEQVKTSEGD